MSKQQLDLADLFGDPTADQEHLTDRPHQEHIDEALDNLRSRINNLRGTGLPDPEYAWDDPANGGPGYYDHTPSQGLTEAQKQIAWEVESKRILGGWQADGSLSGMTRQEGDRIVAARQEQAQVAADLWDAYRAEYSDLAQDVEGAARAVAEVKAGLAAKGINPETYARRNPSKFLDEVATAHNWGANSSDNTDSGRAATISGAGGSSTTWERTEDQGGPDMLFEIQQQQKRSGYY